MACRNWPLWWFLILLSYSSKYLFNYIYDLHNFRVCSNSLLKIASLRWHSCGELFLQLNLQVPHLFFLSTSALFNSNTFISKFLFYLNLLFQHGDIESNPQPDKTKVKNFSCCHWNVNSLVVYKYSKLCQLEAYNLLYNYDFICLSQTYIDSLWHKKKWGNSALLVQLGQIRSA